MAGDAVIFSHFIAINVVVGAAKSSEHVLSFRPDHASVTTIAVAEDGISIVSLGREVAAAGEGGVLLGR
jgi:broad specificity phosphatase PhoE